MAAAATNEMYHINSHRVANAKEPYWKPIDSKAPFGTNCLLINKDAKVPAYGPLHSREQFYTHYHVVEKI